MLRDRPVKISVVKLTPAMINAGMEVLADFDSEYDSLNKTVRRILQAALSVSNARSRYSSGR